MRATAPGPVRRVGIGIALATLLAVSACGARWSDAERAAVFARHRAGSPGQSAPAGVASATTADGTGAGGAAVEPELLGAGASAAGAAGLGAGAGPGSGSPAGPAGPSGPLPCAAPSTAPGVTPTEIRVGSISTLSGPVPGLGASSAAATRAYVAYRNATGGVCGRKVVLREADDGAEGGRYRSAVTDMAPRVLGLLGGFSIGDVGGLDVVEQQKLPVVTVPSNDAGTAVSTLFDINPPFEDPDAVTGKYRFLHEQGVRTATAVYLAVSQSRAEAQKQQRLMKAAGIRVVDVQELPISTLSYDSAARKVANSGADYLFFIGDAHGNSSMARAVHGTGYRLRFAEYFTFSYGSSFIDVAGKAAAEGATSWIRSLPNEEASASTEMQQYLAWMGRIAPGTVRDVFAADAWAGSKAFLDSLEALSGPISRMALVDQLRSIGSYDAGGMLGPIRLGAELTDHCEIAMQVRDGRWQRLTPAQGFLC